MKAALSSSFFSIPFSLVSLYLYSDLYKNRLLICRYIALSSRVVHLLKLENAVCLMQNFFYPTLNRFTDMHGSVSISQSIVLNCFLIVDMERDPVKIRKLLRQPLFLVTLHFFVIPRGIYNTVKTDPLGPK